MPSIENFIPDIILENSTGKEKYVGCRKHILAFGVLTTVFLDKDINKCDLQNKAQ
jgi:hypothetical protein